MTPLVSPAEAQSQAAYEVSVAKNEMVAMRNGVRLVSDVYATNEDLMVGPGWFGPSRKRKRLRGGAATTSYGSLNAVLISAALMGGALPVSSCTY